jgi:ABC-2 type transport system permease protein
LGWFLTFVIPVLLVVNIPARVMVRAIDEPGVVAFALLMTVILLWISRRFFKYALRLYRSASS